MRTLNVGGRQGRGNPSTGFGAHNRAPGRPFDLFALAIASHVEAATPGLRLNVFHPASRQVWTWRSCWCICAGLAMLERLHQVDGGESVDTRPNPFDGMDDGRDPASLARMRAVYRERQRRIGERVHAHDYGQPCGARCDA